MAWFDDIFLKYRTISSGGVPLPRRARTNFIGLTVTDDPVNDATNVTATGGGGGGDATSIQSVPVTATTPTTGQALLFDGANWAPATTSGNFGSGSVTGGIVTAGTRLIAPSIDTTGTGTLLIGTRNTGSGDTGPVSISRTGQTTTVNGLFAVTQTSAFTGAMVAAAISGTTITASTAFNGPIYDSVSGAGATTVSVGATNATGVTVGKTGAGVTFPGWLTPGGGTLPADGFVKFPYSASQQVFLGGRSSGGGDKKLIHVDGDFLYIGEYAGGPVYIYTNVAVINSSISSAVQAPIVGLWNNGGALGFTVTTGSTLKFEADADCTSVAYTQAQHATGTGVSTTITGQVGKSAFASGHLAIGGGAAAGGGGASAAGYVNFVNQTISNTGSSVGGGQSLIGLLVQGVPIMVNGVAKKMMVMDT